MCLICVLSNLCTRGVHGYSCTADSKPESLLQDTANVARGQQKLTVGCRRSLAGLGWNMQLDSMRRHAGREFRPDP